MRLIPTAPLLALAALVPLGAVATGAEAQVRGSEPASLTQTIDGTEITIEYYRPRTRGRSPLFGHDAVVWEPIWTPGANWATTLTFDRPISLDGVEIEPGSWSVWMQMSEEEFLPETLVLDPEPRIFHLDGPEPREGQIRLPMELEENEHFFDLLTWDFTTLRNHGGTLAMSWGNRRATFDIAVEPSMRMIPTPEEAEAVVGEWQTEVQGTSLTVRIHLDEETDMLVWEDEPSVAPEEMEARLAPAAEGVFLWTVWQDGELFSGSEFWVEFFYDESGRATSFELREYYTDELYFTATRAN